MLHWYRVIYSFLMSGLIVRTYSYVKLLDEESLAKETAGVEMQLTWDNIGDYYKQNIKIVPFSLENTKKGRVIKFDNSDYFFFEKDYLKKVKEWKCRDLSVLELKVTCSVRVMDKYKTLQDVLSYPNAEVAAQFLRERGVG